jgi:integrase
MTGVGRIFLRGKRYWVAYYRRGREVRKSAGTESEVKARKFLQAQLRNASLVGREERVTFDELVGLIKADYELRELRSKYDLEKSRLPHLEKAFKELRAIDITTSVRKYSADRKRSGAANATINRELGVLKRAFKLALQDDILSSAPHIQMLPETTVRQGFVSHAQFLAITAELKAPALRDIAEFLYLTGWRLSEAIGLEWRDIEAGLIRLRGENSKTKHPRSLPAKGDLLQILKRCQAARRMSCRFIFHLDGRKLHRGSVSRAWRRAGIRAKCPGIMVHDLRRTAARNLVRSRVPERVVMERLGHRTRSMLDRYNIVSEADMLEAQDRLEAYLGEQPKEQNVRVLSVEGGRK